MELTQFSLFWGFVGSEQGRLAGQNIIVDMVYIHLSGA